MKKKLFSILFIFICSFGFSYGYRNTYWGESAKDMALESGKTNPFSWKEYFIYKEPARMLGQPSTIYYVLENNKLIGITYCVQDTETSRKELDRLFQTHKLSVIQRKYIEFAEEKKEMLKSHWEESAKKYYDYSYIVLNEAIAYYRGGKTLIDLAKDEKKENEIIIADYDADTQVFIYVGVIPEKILVGYVQKQEDF